MTNKEKLTEVFGEFMQNLDSMDDFERWLGSEYNHHEKTFIGDDATKKEFETLMYYPNKAYDPRIIDRFLDSQHRRQNPPKVTQHTMPHTEQNQKEEKPVQFDEEKNGQITFLKDKDLYHFEGWANWYDEDGYLQVGRFDMHTQAKSEAQALSNIKARIKRQNNWPMNKKIDIDLNDGVSTLTKVMPPISEYRVIYPNGSGVEILVNARNIQDVCKKLDKCGIPWKENDAEIKLGNIAE